MRLFRLSLLGLGATTAALLNGYQARAQTAYMWGSNNMHGDHEQIHYQANEVWLMEVDLATGSSNEVDNSRVFAHKEIMNHLNNTNTNELVDGFIGHPDLQGSQLVGNKIYFRSHGCNQNGCEESLGYFDLGAEEYGFAMVDGKPDGLQGSEPTDFFPDGSNLHSNLSSYLVASPAEALSRSTNSYGNVSMTENGIAVNGASVIRKNSDGSVSIGTNSVTFGNEPLGDQSMWATDQNGIVDINITNGTDLMIDGVSVQGQIDENKSAIVENRSAIEKNRKDIKSNRSNINNLGDGIAASTALSAALSALPVTSDDAPFSCGVGSGAYSSRFAVGLGCAAKLNQRLSLNAGGSHVFGGSSDYGGGSLDNVAWRGGFVLKLGKLDSSTDTNEQLQSKVKQLEDRNAANDAKYSEMVAKYSTIEKQNTVIKEQNKALIARLERLEAIAAGQQPAITTASLK